LPRRSDNPAIQLQRAVVDDNGIGPIGTGDPGDGNR
jgi:hypothetical protein